MRAETSPLGAWLPKFRQIASSKYPIEGYLQEQIRHTITCSLGIAVTPLLGFRLQDILRTNGYLRSPWLLPLWVALDLPLNCRYRFLLHYYLPILGMHNVYVVSWYRQYPVMIIIWRDRNSTHHGPGIQAVCCHPVLYFTGIDAYRRPYGISRAKGLVSTCTRSIRLLAIGCF